MNELTVDAKVDNLSVVLSFVDAELEKYECSMKTQMQIDIAVEELFVNIANYAYSPVIGVATVRVEVKDDPLSVYVTFVDEGKPYDPLAKEDPDVSLSAEEREIGGLGIYMVKKSMDAVEYEYKDGANILTIVKQL
ncbi:MAG: ATP-binding protein [Lachnospiraceae bacterium]|nr:ATP-binding protein [Lachnospiraceae bacterium]